MKIIEIGFEFVYGFVFGIEFVPKGEVDDDESYLLLEVGIARILFTFS